MGQIDDAAPLWSSFRQKDEMIAKLNHDNITLQAKLGTLQGAHDRLMADFKALMARAAQTPIVPQPVADVFPVNALNWSVPGYGINPWRRGS